MFTLPKWLSAFFPSVPSPKFGMPPNVGIGVKVRIPISTPAPTKPAVTTVEQAVDSAFQIDSFVNSILGNAPIQPEPHAMKVANLLSIFSLASAVITPLVTLADTFNIPGHQKLDAVVNGVKTIAPLCSDVVTLAEEEWAVMKPAVTSLVSAFADVKHALEAAVVAQPATAPATTPAA